MYPKNSLSYAGNFLHMMFATPCEDYVVTMGIASDGQYGIPKDTMFGFAVTCEGGEYRPVEGLPVDAFSQECINKTLKELQDEQAGVAHLL